MKWSTLVFIYLCFTGVVYADSFYADDLNGDKVTDLLVVQSQGLTTVRFDQNFDKKWDYEIITKGPTQIVKSRTNGKLSLKRVVHQRGDKTLYIEVEGQQSQRVAKVWQAPSQPMQNESKENSESTSCDSYRGVLSVIKELSRVAKGAVESDLFVSCSTLTKRNENTFKEELTKVFEEKGIYCLTSEMAKLTALAPVLVKAFAQLSQFDNKENFFECRKDIKTTQSTVPPMRIRIPLDDDGTLPLDFQEKDITHELIHLIVKQSCHLEQSLAGCENAGQNEKLVTGIQDKIRECRERCKGEACNYGAKSVSQAMMARAQSAGAESQGAPLATISVAGVETPAPVLEPAQVPLNPTGQRGEAVAAATLVAANGEMQASQSLIETAAQAVGDQVLPRAGAVETTSSQNQQSASRDVRQPEYRERREYRQEREYRETPTPIRGIARDRDDRPKHNLNVDDRPLFSENEGQSVDVNRGLQEKNPPSPSSSSAQESAGTANYLDASNLETPAVRDRKAKLESLKTPAVRDREEKLKTPAVRDREAAQAQKGGAGGVSATSGRRSAERELSAGGAREPAAVPSTLQAIDPSSLQGRPAREIAMLIRDRRSEEFAKFEKSLIANRIAIITADGTKDIGVRRKARTCYVMPTLLSLNWTSVPTDHPDLKKTLTKIKCGD